MKLAEPFRSLLPSLAPDAYARLKAKIEDQGLLSPILIDEQNNILDGHHRYQICGELGIEPKVRVHAGLMTDLERKQFILSLNLSERVLTRAERKHIERELRKVVEDMHSQGVPGRQIARALGKPESTVRLWKPAAQPAQAMQVAETTPEKSVTEHKIKSVTAPIERKMSDDDAKSKALELLDAGMAVMEVARAVGREHSTVHKWRGNPSAETGEARRSRQRAERDKIDARVTELAEAGIGTTAIAGMLEVNSSVVSNSLDRLNLDITRKSKKSNNPLQRFTDKIEVDAAVMDGAEEMLAQSINRATADQRNALAAELVHLVRASNKLKLRLNAINKEQEHGQEV